MSAPPMADWMPWAKPMIAEQIFFQRRVRALKEELPSKDELVTLQRRFMRMEEAFASSKKEAVRLQERITTLEVEGAVLKDFKEQYEGRLVAPEQHSLHQQLSQITIMAETIGNMGKKPSSKIADVGKQGQRSLRAYLDDFRSTGTKCEDELVTAFIDGMTSRHYRAALEEALERVGRRWSNLKNEVERMLEDAKRRNKNRRFYDLHAIEFLVLDR